MSTPVAPASTYVAIDRTPSESAASGMIFIGCAVGAARPSYAASAVDLDARAGDHRGVVGGEEHRGGGDVGRLVQATERYRGDVGAQPLLVHLALVHERRQHRRVRGH